MVNTSHYYIVPDYCTFMFCHEWHTAVTVQLDQTSVRIDEDFGEIVITVFMQGQSELNVSVQVDTRVDTASGKNTIRLPSIS